MTDTNNLIETLRADATAVKPALHPYIVAGGWVLGLIIYVSLMAGFFGLRPDLMDKFQDSLFMAELTSLAALIISSALSALLLSYPDMYQKHSVVYTPLPIALIFIGVVTMEWLKDVPPSPMPDHGMDCLLCISGLSLLPALFLFYRMHTYAGTHCYMAGAIAAISAFSVGAFVLRLSEETNSIMHIVEWHYLPTAAVAVIGLVLGRLVLKW